MNLTIPQKKTSTANPIRIGMTIETREIKPLKIPTTSCAKAICGTKAAESVAPKVSAAFAKALDIVHKCVIRTDTADNEAHDAEDRDHNEHPDDPPEHGAPPL